MKTAGEISEHRNNIVKTMEVIKNHAFYQYLDGAVDALQWVIGD